MPDKKSFSSVMKQNIILPLKEQALIPLPVPWLSFQFEYDSPVLWLPEGPSEWNFVLSFANRSAVDQQGYYLLTEYQDISTQPVWSQGPFSSHSGQIVNSVSIIQVPIDYQPGLWLHIFVTSRDLIPSLHVYALSPELYHPEFYFSPGDFAFFEVPGGYTPPGTRPTRKP